MKVYDGPPEWDYTFSSFDLIHDFPTTYAGLTLSVEKVVPQLVCGTEDSTCFMSAIGNSNLYIYNDENFAAEVISSSFQMF